MKKKRILSLVLMVFMLMSGLSPEKTVHAEGWLDTVQDVDLDEWYSDTLSDGYDYDLGDMSKAYEVEIEKKGILKIKIESDLNKIYEIEVYEADNVDEVYSNIYVNLKKSSARGIYYGTVKTNLKAGTYYLFFSGGRYLENYPEYSFILKHKKFNSH